MKGFSFVHFDISTIQLERNFFSGMSGWQT